MPTGARHAADICEVEGLESRTAPRALCMQTLPAHLIHAAGEQISPCLQNHL